MNRACILAGLLLCILSAALSGADAPQQKKADPAPEKHIPREQLRCDGRGFESWRTELLTELNPEVRVRALKAMRRFASNGYASEASAAALEVMGSYDFEANDDYDEERSLLANAVKHVLRVAGKAGEEELVRAISEPPPTDMLAWRVVKFNNCRRFALDNISSSDVNRSLILPRLGELALLKEESVSRRAIKTLVEWSEEQAAADALARVFKEGAVAARLAAVTQLGPVWSKDKQPELLLAAVKDKEPKVRTSVAFALVGESETVLRTLDGLLKDRNEGVRQGAFGAFFSMNCKARPILPMLLNVLRKGEVSDRVHAISLLRLYRVPPSEIRRILDEALKDSNAEVRKAASEALSSVMLESP